LEQPVDIIEIADYVFAGLESICFERFRVGGMIYRFEEGIVNNNDDLYR
jgi:hypothetical protein